MRYFEESELLINANGSIYHLNIHPENIANDIIVVGDPSRVIAISSFFDKIEFKQQNREFITHTGVFNGKRITAMSTGIGTNNIDIVMNELDALANIDFKRRVVNNEFKSLNIIRLGTSGALQPEIEPDSLVFSSFVVGIDGLMNYYNETESVIDIDLTNAFIKDTAWNNFSGKPYAFKATDILEEKLGKGMYKGITVTSPGFYGPQGRFLRMCLADEDANIKLQNFRYNELKIANYEMETSVIYGMGKILGHNTASICLVVANRFTKTFSKDYHRVMDSAIEKLLYNITI